MLFGFYNSRGAYPCDHGVLFTGTCKLIMDNILCTWVDKELVGKGGVVRIAVGAVENQFIKSDAHPF
jgi:hypothetical protein